MRRRRPLTLWLITLTVWSLLGWARCSTPPPYRGPVHVLPAGAHTEHIG